MRVLLLLLLLLSCPAVFASYQLAELLPGEAVDVQTDLTAFSFSVPHALKRYGFSAAPNYRYESHVGGSNADLHSGGGELFGYLQWERLRLGVKAKNSAAGGGVGYQGAQTDTKAMVSYLLPFMSFGLEGGGFRSQNDDAGRWGGMGALSLGIYSNSWGIDAVARVYRQNASYAAPAPLAAGSLRGGILPRSGELYALRLRHDVSFAWRSVVAFNGYFAANADFYSVANTWRYRSGFLQFFTGINYSLSQLRDAAIYFGVERIDQINLPAYLILEHGRSVFYIGASAPVFTRFQFGDRYNYSSAIFLQPQLAYTYRFKPNLWAGFTLAAMSANFAGSSQDSELRRNFNVAFQIAYNIVPFGFDDEIPSAQNLLMAQR